MTGTAYEELVEPWRRELHAHCYRMLGSVHDADDALQDALLRAWRGLPRVEGRSSIRTWLYRIATNACLDLVARRPARQLPIDAVSAAAIHTVPAPLVESVWIEPYPDEELGLACPPCSGPCSSAATCSASPRRRRRGCSTPRSPRRTAP